MGFKSLQIKLPTDYHDGDIGIQIRKSLGLTDFEYQIEKKSLDARHKGDIHWLISLVVSSDQLQGDDYVWPKPLEVPHRQRPEQVVVVGSGPAGFFAAHVLQMAGFQVTLLERGSEVERRTTAIEQLDRQGVFSPANNYAFGEGGAGTFSDGKLTSRSKHISAERWFVLNEYVKAGAPQEILHMAHPHVGTDHLKLIVANLRKTFQDNGGQMLFDMRLDDLVIKGGKVTGLQCSQGLLEADHIVLATGHSAYDVYRMLLKRGVLFNTKNFAVGHRIEHPQRIVNLAQWGREQLAGVKAAEYRLSTNTRAGLQVYTFCMCPGGQVVQSAAYEQRSVVNGMSVYQRDGQYANAGCVVGVHPDALVGHTSTPLEILDWMDRLEERYYAFSNDYRLPCTAAASYISKKKHTRVTGSSYMAGLQPAALYEMLPDFVVSALAEGLQNFNRKMKGFDSGLLMGLESKTSSPLQVARDRNGQCQGFHNLYFVGEGSGYAGGIVSSAADGIRCALSLSS